MPPAGDLLAPGPHPRYGRPAGTANPGPAGQAGAAAAVVIAPSPILTITAEADGEIHLHPGGQGFWVARMIARMHVPVVMCSAFGGEAGTVLRALAAAEQVALAPVSAAESNGALIELAAGHGKRIVLDQMQASPLRRHAVDDLYGASLARGLAARVTVLTGTDPGGLVPAGFYRRLAHDLRANGRLVLADLAGGALTSAIAGGLAVVKASHEELAAAGLACSDTSSLISWLRWACASGADNAIVTRGSQPALALLGGSLIEARFPVTRASDSRGAGDSLTAAFAAALARGDSLQDALRLSIAAGMLNAARRGLGTGRAEDIAAVADQVSLATLEPGLAPVTRERGSETGPAVGADHVVGAIRQASAAPTRPPDDGTR